MSSAKQLSDLPMRNDSPEDYVHYLREFSLLNELEEDGGALVTFAQILKPVQYKRGDLILEHGSSDNTMCFLLKGSVDIIKFTASGDRFVVAKFHDTDHPHFGEGAILSEQTRSSTIEATSSCICLELFREDFETFCDLYPQWGLPILKAIARLLSSRLRKTTKDFVTLYEAYIEEIRGEMHHLPT